MTRLFISNIMDLVPRKFPDGTTEVYSYEAIAAKGPDGTYDMPPVNKQHNAESYALLAACESIK